MLSVEECHVQQLREKLRVVRMGIERSLTEASARGGGSGRFGSGRIIGSGRLTAAAGSGRLNGAAAGASGRAGSVGPGGRQLSRRPSIDLSAVSQKVRTFSERIFASHEEEMKFCEKTYGKLGWPTLVVEFFYSLPVQISSIALLTVDVLIIIFELYLDIEYPSCLIIQRDAVSCCNGSAYLPAPPPAFYDADDLGRYCPPGLAAVEQYQIACDDAEAENWRQVRTRERHTLLRLDAGPLRGRSS